MKNFIDKEIEKVKADIVWHTKYLAENKAVVEACVGIPALEKNVEEAQSWIDHCTNRMVYFDKMLDVFYTARDLKCKCK